MAADLKSFSIDNLLLPKPKPLAPQPQSDLVPVSAEATMMFPSVSLPLAPSSPDANLAQKFLSGSSGNYFSRASIMSGLPGWLMYGGNPYDKPVAHSGETHTTVPKPKIRG